MVGVWIPERIKQKRGEVVSEKMPEDRNFQAAVIGHDNV